MFERTEQALTTIGLVLSGMVFAAGVAGLLYVAVHVMATSPPTFGSQGEWLYGAGACLIVAGWGFSQAAKFAVRIRSSRPRPTDAQTPTIHVAGDGLSIDMPRPQLSDTAAKPSTRGLTWSFSTTRRQSGHSSSMKHNLPLPTVPPVAAPTGMPCAGRSIQSTSG